MFNAGEARRLPHPARVIGDPLERNLLGLTHVTEQADDRALVLDLGLVDYAADGKGIEHLPHRLRMALRQDLDDRVLDGLDRRLGPAIPFYVASYIKWRLGLGRCGLAGKRLDG